MTVSMLTACTPPTAESSFASPIPSSAARCEVFQLSSPQGNRIDLTGIWNGRGARHYVRQLGDCVWWFALSDIPGDPPGSAFSITFRGEIRPDFTLVGEWAFVVKPSRPDAPPVELDSITFSIEFDDIGGEEAVIIKGPGADATTGGPVANFYSAITLERVGPLPVGQ
jgi:hypothetical protein